MTNFAGDLLICAIHGNRACTKQQLAFGPSMPKPNVYVNFPFNSLFVPTEYFPSHAWTAVRNITIAITTVMCECETVSKCILRRPLHCRCASIVHCDVDMTIIPHMRIVQP